MNSRYWTRDAPRRGAVKGRFLVATLGYPAGALSETGSLPSGVTFNDNANGTATLAGTPAAGTAGVYTVKVNATNGFATSTQTFTLTVDATQRAPRPPGRHWWWGWRARSW